MLQIGSAKKHLLSAAFAVAAIALLSSHVAVADTFQYTFTGTGSGSITDSATTTDFTDASYTLTFTESTSAITNPDVGYYALPSITGTFTEGAFTETLTDSTIEVNGNGSVGGNYEDVLVFGDQADPSLLSSLGVFSDGNLLNYALSTPITVSGADVGAIVGASDDSYGFVTTNGQLDFDNPSALTFTATDLSTPAVPEPSTLLLLGTGLSAGLGLLRRRFSI